MLISYEPNSDVLTLTLQATPIAQVQPQGASTVSFDAAGRVVSVSVPNASSVLWENGGQVQVLVPTEVAPVPAVAVVAPVAVAPVVVAPR